MLFAFSAIFCISTIEILARYGMLSNFKAICHWRQFLVVAKFFVDIDNAEGSLTLFCGFNPFQPELN